MASPQRSPLHASLDVRESRDLRFCMACRSKPNLTEYVCGDCALSLCAACRVTHESIPQFASHRAAPYFEMGRCSQHGKRQLLVCKDCACECCFMCAQYGKHRGHTVEDRAAEQRAQQAALERENEQLKKHIEGKLQSRIELLRAFSEEVGVLEEAAVKAFQSLVAERKAQLTLLYQKYREEAEAIKAPCESDTVECLLQFRETLQKLDEEPGEFPEQLAFSFSQPLSCQLPRCEQHVEKLHLSAASESPRAQTALVQGAESEESLPGDERGNGFLTEDPHSPPESELRNPTVPPKSRECLYLPLSDSDSIAVFDMEMQRYQIERTDRIWPRFCGFTLLAAKQALVTGGGDQPSRMAISLNLDVFESAELHEMLIARNHHSSITVYDGALVVGGFNQVMQNTCEFYTPEKDEWHTISAMNIARGALGLCGHKGVIYAFGGWDGHREVAKIERLKHLDAPWELLEMQLPSPSQCNAVSLDSLVLIFAYQAECAYAFTPDGIEVYCEIKNEAWGRPELVRYRDFVFCFKSDVRKVFRLETRRKQFVSIDVQQ